MSEERNKHTNFSIEAAMERVAKDVGEAIPNASSNKPRSVGRRDYDKALSRRLNQLHHAMGIDDSTPIPLVAPPPPVESARHSSFEAGPLILTAFFSSLAGAGAMWLATGNVAPPHLPSAAPPALIAPVLDVAPPVAAAIVVKSADSMARELVEDWRMAWSKRDTEAYLNFYSPAFMPADGSTRAHWAVARRKNLAGRPDIQVSVRELEITPLAEDRLKVSFQQDYISGNYREYALLKTLLLTLDSGRWQIVEEWSGAQAAEKKAR